MLLTGQGWGFDHYYRLGITLGSHELLQPTPGTLSSAEEDCSVLARAFSPGVWPRNVAMETIWPSDFNCEIWIFALVTSVLYWKWIMGIPSGVQLVLQCSFVLGTRLHQCTPEHHTPWWCLVKKPRSGQVRFQPFSGCTDCPSARHHSRSPILIAQCWVRGDLHPSRQPVLLTGQSESIESIFQSTVPPVHGSVPESSVCTNPYTAWDLAEKTKRKVIGAEFGFWGRATSNFCDFITNVYAHCMYTIRDDIFYFAIDKSAHVDVACG